MNHTDQKTRVAISEDNVSIVRDENKCIKCGECARICNDFVSVNNNYNLNKTNGNPICVNCGQCLKVCPANSIQVREEYKQVQKEILNTQKVAIVSTSPAVRVALGDEFGLEKGSMVEGKMVALLKKLGFKYVLDTNFGADLTICEEATELISRLKSGKNLPQFTSCCPAWVKFAETFYPEIIDNISTCKSPISMQSVLIKTYFANKMNINPENIVNIALTPCVAKKFEIRRQELNTSAKVHNVPNMRDMDYVITTTELADWAKQENINLKELNDEPFDNLMGVASGAGAIFGNTGGVMEAAVRTAYSYLTGNKPEELSIEYHELRDCKDILEASIKLGENSLKLAVVCGLANARKIIEKLKQGEKFDFIEVMSCPGGCIGGGGQPKHLGREEEYKTARASSIYKKDKASKYRVSNENPEIIQLYKDYLAKPGSHLAEELLHTMYEDKSASLGKIEQEVINVTKYKCKMCDEEFEIVDGEPIVCPRCKMGKDMLTVLAVKTKKETGKYFGTKTQDNLIDLFKQEACEYIKYSYIADKLKDQGDIYLADIISKIAQKEKAHAFVWLDELYSNTSIINALKDAEQDEKLEWANKIEEYKKCAIKEDFTDLAYKLEGLKQLEKDNEVDFKNVLHKLEENSLQESENEVVWECSVCGHKHKGKTPPNYCSVCGKNKEYFVVSKNNY